MKRIGYIKGARIRGPVDLGPGGSLNAPGGIVGLFSFGFGNIYYVDATNGDNDNDGLSPQTPLLTITAALAKCTDGNDDYVIIRGGFNESFTVSKEKVHLLGLKNGRGKGYETRINPGAGATGPTILIQAYDVEIADMIVIGHRDTHEPAIFADGANGGCRSHIHGCFITGVMTPDGTHYHIGIHLAGDRHVVEYNEIDQCSIGVYVDQEGGQRTYELLIINNYFGGCDIGIDVHDASGQGIGSQGLIIDDNVLDAVGAVAETTGIRIQALGQSALLTRNLVGGYTTPITNAGTANLIENYEETGGGTLINV